MTARQDRALALAVGGVLALVLALWSAFSLAAWSIGSVSRSEHRVLHGDIRQVLIEGTSGDITLVPSSGSEVVVDGHAKGSLWVPKMSTRVDGNRVSVHGKCHVAVFGSCSVRFVVHVPRGVSVRAKAESGDVRASGLSGNLRLAVSSGDVELDALGGGATVNLSSGDIMARGVVGRVALKTASGDVVASELRSASVSARSESGDVVVDDADVPGSVDAGTSSGDVTITVPNGVYAADADTASGDRQIAVRTDPSSPRSLRAITSSGDVRVLYR
jgi:hypothetical protein